MVVEPSCGPGAMLRSWSLFVAVEPLNRLVAALRS